MKHIVFQPRMATLLFILIIAICTVWKNYEQCLSYDKNTEDALIERVNTENTWMISYQRVPRKETYTQIDATDRHLYLSYSKDSCVDVFDHHGVFQYAILLPNCQNGTVQIRCADNQLIVSDKNNMVYIFRGNEATEQMNHDQACLMGYDFFWFKEKEPIQKVKDSVYYEIDEDGNVVREIMLPSKLSNINPLRTVLFVVAFLLYCFSLLKYFLLKYNS